MNLFWRSEAKDAARMLRRMSVETNSLMCLGCGYEHDCSTRGCAILNRAAYLLAAFAAESTADGEPREEARE